MSPISHSPATSPISKSESQLQEPLQQWEARAGSALGPWSPPIEAWTSRVDASGNLVAALEGPLATEAPHRLPQPQPFHQGMRGFGVRFDRDGCSALHRSQVFDQELEQSLMILKDSLDASSPLTGMPSSTCLSIIPPRCKPHGS